VYARELVTVPLLGPFVVSDQVEHASEGFGEGDLQGFEEERRSYLLHLWDVDHLVELVLNALRVVLDAFAHFLTHSEAQLRITTFRRLLLFLVGRFVPAFNWGIFPNLFPPHRPVPLPIVGTSRSMPFRILQPVERNLQRIFIGQEFRLHQ
jgi:hypothetical protein